MTKVCISSNVIFMNCNSEENIIAIIINTNIWFTIYTFEREDFLDNKLQGWNLSWNLLMARLQWCVIQVRLITPRKNIWRVWVWTKKKGEMNDFFILCQDFHSNNKERIIFWQWKGINKTWFLLNSYSIPKRQTIWITRYLCHLQTLFPIKIYFIWITIYITVYLLQYNKLKQ